MINPEHLRPFNLEYAKQGAPVSTAQWGEWGEVRILDFDIKSNFPIVGVITDKNGDGFVNTWTSSGGYMSSVSPHPKDLKMAPLGYIQDKPFYCGDTIVAIEQNHLGSYNEGYTKKTTIVATPDVSKGKIYIWPEEPKVMFKGRELTLDSVLYYYFNIELGTEFNPNTFIKKEAKDFWRNGLENTTLYEYLKNGPTSDDGKLFWEVQPLKVKQQLWQPKLKKDINSDIMYIGSNTFQYKAACDNHYDNCVNYVGAELISSWWGYK